MNAKQMLEVMDSGTIGKPLESVSVYTTNDQGNLVPVKSAKIIVQRDEVEVLVLVLER